MNRNGEDVQGMRKLADLSWWISMTVLLLHFYYYCYDSFQGWRLTTDLSDRLLVTIAGTGLFEESYISKLIALVFLSLALLGRRGRKQGQFSVRGGLTFILAGLIFYFGSSFLIAADTDALAYMAATFTGYLLVLTGGVYLSRVIAYSMRKGFFNKDAGGFRQEERLIETEYSLNFPASYLWNGKRRSSHISLVNGRRGVLICGNPGCGKSWLIIEPAIRQLIERGFALFALDYKYPVLTSFAYAHFLENRHSYPASAAFYCINFTDLTRSRRCNVIEPATLHYLSDAIGTSRTILLSMNKTWVNRQGEFFVESPINFLAALIWWLRQYKGGLYCTLPHVIELAQVPYDILFTLLGAEPSIQTLINPFIEVYKNKSMELVDSQLSSAKIPLGRLASPDLYYILTGNDFSLAINDPAAPKIFCLGSDPPRQEALSPILSLYIDRLNKLVNQQGKYKCGLVCDEFATVRAYTMISNIFPTARSNNIIPIIAVQDISQLRTHYSREEADLVVNTAGNLMCGQVGGETARWVSERIPPVMQYKTTISINSSDTSISRAEQPGDAVTPSTIATLSSGEFTGIVADDPGRELELKAFHARLERRGRDLPRVLPPVVHDVDEATVQEAFARVKQDIQKIVGEETRRIAGDPALAGLVVKG